MENVLSIAGSGQGLSYWSLIAHASLLVQLVMLLLLLASLFSWTVIFARRAVLKAAVREADDFEDAFWSGGDTTELYNRWTARGKNQSGMATLFVSGYREYSRLAGKGGVDRNNVLDGVGRAMRVALSREIDALENHLSFLATVGSTSPYVGLFGTVWGIMNSFRSLGTMQQATIASVAPGIAEALVATAMGLFAAIPAVIAYNRFSNRVERLVARYETFIEEFLSIVGRQSFTAPAVQPTSARHEIHAA